MQIILLVSAGGAVGALMRYAVSGVAYRILGPSFPWGTLAVNILGCFFIGIVWALVEGSSASPASRTFILTGILGAFTTFSTFGIETINLFRGGEISLAIVNVLASNVGGILAVVLGLMLVRFLTALGGGS
ncbi:MAG: fluoride efflux transporter CrcB [Rhodothermales bacterium]